MTEVTATALRTYLTCPRQYEFAHHLELSTGDSVPTERRLTLCRAAIRRGLAVGPDPDSMTDAAHGWLAEVWADHEEPFHSSGQRAHARRVVAAIVESYLRGAGPLDAGGMTALPEGVEAIAPELTARYDLESTTVDVSLPIDALTVRDGDLVAIRFSRFQWRLGALRYYDDWDGPVESAFTDHVSGEDADVATVATLLETAAVLEGCRALSDRRCRYVVVPLLDDGAVQVNWLDGTVEATVSPIDLTDAYVDHRTLGRTLEHRNDAVDRHLRSVLSAIATGTFSPVDRWEEIAQSACPRCRHRVCCQDATAAEVRFDG